jgi:hypothetical protein
MVLAQREHFINCVENLGIAGCYGTICGQRDTLFGRIATSAVMTLAPSSRSCTFGNF